MGTIRDKTLFDCFRQFGARARRVCVALSILFWGLTGPNAAAQAQGKNVLILFRSVQYSDEFMNVVEPAIRARVPGPVTFYDAYMDDPQIEEKSYRESMAETLRNRYAGVKMDALIANNPGPLAFAVEYRDRIFPGVPIIFTRVGRPEDLKQGPGITGVVSPSGFHKTVDLALQLEPDTKAIAVVAGVTNWDTLQLAYLHSELLGRQDKVKEIDIVGPPNREQLARVAKLPPHTVVFFQTFPQFSTQEQFGTTELLSEVAKVAPTYSVFYRLCVNGCIGGVFLDSKKEWLTTAEMAARVLKGERPENIPIVYDSGLDVRVDWRELQRWHIPESRLPLGCVILDRPPTLWERDRKYIIIALLVIAAQMLLIIALLWQRARKRKVEAVLRESEERFRVMADTTPSLVWMCDAHGKVTYLNERRIAFTGPDPHARYGETWIANVHPDDVKNVLDTLYKALETQKAFSQEYRLRRSDGVYRWMLDVASPRVNGDGSFAGFIGSAIDVTDQKVAQQGLEKMSGQLIEAQEKERSRIARDLHDDICQRLVLLSMEIEQANRSPDGSSKNLEEIRRHCAEIAGDVQSLSHELHSSKLDYLGVVAAIKGICSEFSKQHKVSIAFTDSNVPVHLSKEVSLCLFRVAQEALHNAVKYSGTNQFTVRISGTADEVQLEVRDAGAGFDVAEAKKRRGLGLASMQERVHLVHGRLFVESQPGKGTRILAVVPLSAAGGDSEEPNLTHLACDQSGSA